MQKTRENKETVKRVGRAEGDIESINPTMAHSDKQYEEPNILKIDVDIPQITAGGNYRMGNISEDERDDMADKEEAQEKFANQMKQLITAMIQKKKIMGKLKGHEKVVSVVTNLLKREKGYLSNLISGKSADEPIMIKSKGLIDKESKKLRDLSGLIWPFNSSK